MKTAGSQDPTRLERMLDITTKVRHAKINLGVLQVLQHALGFGNRGRHNRLGWRNRYATGGPAAAVQAAVDAGLMEHVGSGGYRVTAPGLFLVAAAAGITRVRDLDAEALAALDVTPAEADIILWRLA